MQLNPSLNPKVLLDYGFVLINKEEEESNDNNVISLYDYKFSIGHSRRGQFYYILVNSNGNVNLYASEPDGSGGSIGMPDVLVKLFRNEVFI